METNEETGQSGKVKGAAAVAIVTGIVVAFAGLASAQAAPDTAVVTAATDGGELMADTLRAVGMALIPLAIGVLVVKKGWRIVRGFF